MLSDAEREREREVNRLIQRISKLPKSFQLQLAGEKQFLSKTRFNLQQELSTQENREVNTEKLRSCMNFRSENYIEDLTDKGESFDVILCLSTIKWIHCNFGDNGLKALFLKAHSQLSPGGLFIFDSQPWKSYKKVKSGKKNNYTVFEDVEIQLKPHFFKQYLKLIGMRLLMTAV